MVSISFSDRFHDMMAIEWGHPASCAARSPKCRERSANELKEWDEGRSGCVWREMFVWGELTARICRPAMTLK